MVYALNYLFYGWADALKYAALYVRGAAIIALRNALEEWVLAVLAKSAKVLK